MRTLILLLAALAPTALSAATLEADVDFWRPTLDAEFRTDTSTGPGTELRLTDLGMDPTQEVFFPSLRINLLRQSLRAEFKSIEYEGVAQIPLLSPILVGDQNYVGTIKTWMLTERCHLDYIFSILSVSRLRLGVGLTLGGTRYLIRVSGVNPPLPSEKVDTFAPCAGFCVELDVRPLKWVGVRVLISGVSFSSHDQDIVLVRYLRLNASAYYSPNPAVVFHAGLQGRSIDFRDVTEDDSVYYRETISGLYTGVSIRF